MKNLKKIKLEQFKKKKSWDKNENHEKNHSLNATTDSFDDESNETLTPTKIPIVKNSPHIKNKSPHIELSEDEEIDQLDSDDNNLSAHRHSKFDSSTGSEDNLESEDDDSFSEVDSSEDNSDDENHSRLIQDLQKKKLIGGLSSKDRKLQEENAGSIESEFHLQKNYQSPDLNLKDLLGHLEDEGESVEVEKLKHQLKQLTKKSYEQTLSTPLEEIDKKRMHRDIQYKEGKKQIDNKWLPFVEVTQARPQLHFPLEKPAEALKAEKMKITGTTSFKSDFQKEVEEILQNSEVLELPTENFGDQIGFQELSKEELQKRETEIRKIKNKLANLARKNIHASKIKSKKYHRIKKKEKERQKLSLDELREIDPELAMEEEKKRELSRLRERVTGKHSRDRSKVTKKVLSNNHTAIQERDRLRQDLLKKTGVEDDSSDESDDNNDDQDFIEYADEPTKSASVKLVEHLVNKAPISESQADENLRQNQSYALQNIPHAQIITHQSHAAPPPKQSRSQAEVSNKTFSELARTHTAQPIPREFEMEDFPEPEKKEDFFSKLKDTVLKSELSSNPDAQASKSPKKKKANSTPQKKEEPQLQKEKEPQLQKEKAKPAKSTPQKKTESQPQKEKAKSANSTPQKKEEPQLQKEKAKPANSTPQKKTEPATQSQTKQAEIFDSENPWLGNSSNSKELVSKKDRSTNKVGQVRIDLEDVIQVNTDTNQQIKSNYKSFRLSSDEGSKEMIKRAFVDTKLEQEFEEERQQYLEELSGNLSQKRTTQMPGWGSWAGCDIEEQVPQKPVLSAKQSEKVQKKIQTVSPHEKVIIYNNAAIHDKNNKYKITALPKNVTRTNYKKILNTPIAQEFNSLSSFGERARPRITFSTGIEIQPPQIEHLQSQSEFAKRSDIPFRFQPKTDEEGNSIQKANLTKKKGNSTPKKGNSTQKKKSR